MAGRRSRAAASMITSRLVAVSGLGVTISPPFGSRANSLRTRTISSALRTPAPDTVTPDEVEAASATRRKCDICADLRNVDNADPSHRRRDFLEHAQPFPAKRWLEIVEPGDISRWTREACDIPA